MIRFVIFLVGFGFSIIGFVYIIAYLNYLTIGYSFIDYIKLIMTRVECLIVILGFILLNIAIFKGSDNHGVCL